jgi:hypothetical protein
MQIESQPRDARVSTTKQRLCKSRSQDMGKPVKFIVGQNYNHFELLETFANP